MQNAVGRRSVPVCAKSREGGGLEWSEPGGERVGRPNGDGVSRLQTTLVPDLLRVVYSGAERVCGEEAEQAATEPSTPAGAAQHALFKATPLSPPLSRSSGSALQAIPERS